MYIEIMGWVGSFLVVLAYFLLSSKRLREESRIYHGMNLFGGIFLGINAITNSAYPSAAVNIVWILIAIYGIAKGAKLFARK